MSGLYLSRGIFPAEFLRATVDFILAVQKPDGEIPWFEGGYSDPWDHVEAAMGLSIGGHHDAARAAFEWMARVQREDGSWYTAYRDGLPEDFTRETHFSTYIAVGVFHHFLITRDIDFLRKMWDTVRKGIEFALHHQNRGGQISWAVSPDGKADPMALLTGSCSVYMSLKCALSMARHLNYRSDGWEEALDRLGAAIRNKPHLFNMTKSRYAMDWFYPVLTGVLTGAEARRRIDRASRYLQVRRTSTGNPEARAASRRDDRGRNDAGRETKTASRVKSSQTSLVRLPPGQTLRAAIRGVRIVGQVAADPENRPLRRAGFTPSISNRG